MTVNPREPGTSEDPVQERGRLERTLGPAATLTIGLGKMVGAGIFVFPGLAVGEAGPAAALRELGMEVETGSAALERHLRDAGLTAERIGTRSAGEDGRDPNASRIAEAAEGSDLIILGETAREDREDPFGGLSARVTRDAEIPVLVVRAHTGEEVK